MADINHLIFFGDSLTDQGVLSALTSRAAIVTIPVQSAGYGTAFTNGAVHARVLTDALGVSAENHAVGGAHAVGSVTLERYLDQRLANQSPGLDIHQPDASEADLQFDIDFGAQARRFLADAAATPPLPGTAAGYFIGLNDYSEFTPTSPETALAEATALLTEVVGNTIESAAAARLAGVETILLYTMPQTAEALYFRAHDLKGLGTTYEYPLVTRIAGSLCRLLDDADTRMNAPVVVLDAHIDAIRAVVRDQIKTDDHPTGRVLAETLEAKVAEHRQA